MLKKFNELYTPPFKHMEPYYRKKEEFINSITNFADIDDDKIRKIFDFIGSEGYNDEEDAFIDFKEKIKYYQQMPDPVRLYRVVGVKNKKMIKTDNIGQHFTPFEMDIDGDMLMSIGWEIWDDDAKPYIIEVDAPISEIDVLQTIIQNLSFPNEQEINLKNDGKGAKFIKAKKMED